MARYCVTIRETYEYDIYVSAPDEQSAVGEASDNMPLPQSVGPCDAKLVSVKELETGRDYLR